jgi:hypothetical protein
VLAPMEAPPVLVVAVAPLAEELHVSSAGPQVERMDGPNPTEVLA